MVQLEFSCGASIFTLKILTNLICIDNMVLFSKSWVSDGVNLVLLHILTLKACMFLSRTLVDHQSMSLPFLQCHIFL